MLKLERWNEASSRSYKGREIRNINEFLQLCSRISEQGCATMASSLPLDGRAFVLDWMCFLRTSLPAIDFESRCDSTTAVPGMLSWQFHIVVSAQMVLGVLTFAQTLLLISSMGQTLSTYV